MVLFGTIASVGVLLLLISALFGGHHIGHDHDFHGHEGGHDHELHHGDASHHLDEHAPSPFSTQVISLFLVGFGAAGVIASNGGFGTIGSCALSVLAGLCTGALGFRFIKFLWGQQASSTVSTEDLVGKSGTVITTIPFSGIGEISLTVKGQLLHLMAREIGDDEVDEGTDVFVVEMRDDVVIVHRS
jgi:membrane protein implicated in regulation of membrane protease activity